MVNGVDIAVGGVSGAGFGVVLDFLKEVGLNAAEFPTSCANFKSTVEALVPLVNEIEGKNNGLGLQDEELKDLKEEVEAGVNRVKELSEEGVWNFLMRPRYNTELDGMDKSLQRLLRILQAQGVRDVKEILVQVKEVLARVEEVLVQVKDCKTDVNKISSQLDDCKTEIVDGISALGGKTTDQLDQVASNGKETLVQVNKVSSQLDGCKTDVNKISNQLDDCKTEIMKEISKSALDIVERINGPSGLVPINEKVASLVERETLVSSLLRMGLSVDKALSKPNPHFERLERTRVLTRWINQFLRNSDDIPKCLLMPFDEVNTLRIKVEEGTKLISECSNVVVWTDHNMEIYASKLDDLAKFLDASVQRLKRTNSTKGLDTSTMPKGFDTSTVPKGFDTSTVPKGFDTSTMPKGFDTQNSRVHFCSLPFSFPGIKSSIDCC